MKKSLIALSVLAGMVGVAQAENTTTLYGSMAHSVTVADDSSVNKTTWDLNRSVARFGIRGTEDLNGGLQAFYRFEFNAYDNGISGKEGTRQAYLGLKGDFGTLTLGRQKTLFATATDFNDNFQDVYFDYHHGPNRLSKVISYVSPDMSGFKIGASMILDGNNEVISSSDSKGIDAWEGAAFYEANGIFAGGAYQYRDAGKGSQELMGGSVGYKNDAFKVGLGYEHESSADSYYNLAGEYYLDPSNTLRAGFGYDDGKGKNDWYEYALGYQYNLSERTYTWVEGSYYDPRQKGAEDTYKVVVGVRHDF
ncbi:MAG: porin [Cardiobacteriaceae bacterium]|nr:porin [Cardiobacteriaceae bacterium]